MDISIIIRTYNEQRHLPEVLGALAGQELDGMKCETIIVDSGSTDNTLEIASAHGCRIVYISKDEFTFGRSSNIGCDAAEGNYLVFVSGHCIPVNSAWLVTLIKPLQQGLSAYCYGRQIGNGHSRFSECQIFRKYFPEASRIPQEGFFCNNANAGLLRGAWEKYRFDEELTGLEDMELAKRLVSAGLKIAYTADSVIYHLHNETWEKVRNRYERESIALQHIMPQVHISFSDFLRYFFSALLLDSGAALQEHRLVKTFPEIFMFRLMQFWGGYKGNNEHRRLSKAMKEKYFFPK